MATCVWKPNAVWKRTARDLQPASYCNSGGRYGGDYDGLDRPLWIIPTAVELHLLHIRLFTPELRRRIPLLPERAWNATPVPLRAENLSPLRKMSKAVDPRDTRVLFVPFGGVLENQYRLNYLGRVGDLEFAESRA